ncbi:MAG: hypothetical protein L0I76_38055, partial [Pseudonocardia sp.]|nr:hypothetical protein [Pseudonocardia sp.]
CRQSNADAIDQRPLAAVQRRAHHPVLPARGRWFHPNTTHPPQQLRPHLIRALLGDGDVLNQPLDSGVLVGERALAEPEQCAYLRPVPLDRAP